MSASREKKQRQDATGSEKGAQARNAKTAYKRKVRTYTAVGVIIALLVAALLVWNSGIFQRRATAATVGSEKLSVSELSYYYYDARYIYAAYNMIDTSKSDDAQMYNADENKTYRDFFLEQALSSAQRVQARYEAALAAGHTDSEVKDDVDAQIKSMKSAASSSGYGYSAYLRAIYGEYMTPGVLKDVLTKSLLGDRYWSEVQTEKHDAFTADQLEAYYTEHPDDVDVFEYSYLYFKAEDVSDTDADGNKLTDDELAAKKLEAMTAAKAKADAALELYEGGVALDKVITDTTPTSSADHTTATGSGALSSTYREELLKLGKDKATVVEYDSYGYYVIVFHSRSRDEDFIANVRHILVRAENTTDSEGKTVAPTDEAWAAAEEQAKTIMAEYEAGEHTDAAFAALAEKYSDDRKEDGSLAADGGLYTNITKSSGYVTEFKDWCVGDDRPEIGEVGLVRHEGTAGSPGYWGYHVMYLQGWGEAEWQYSVRAALTSEAMTEWQDSLTSSGRFATALADGANSLGR